MEQTISKIFISHLVKDNLVDSIHDKISQQKAGIIEIIGESDSGKSLFIKNLCDKFSNDNIDYSLVIPSSFRLNHFEEIFRVLSGISEDKCLEILNQALELPTESKYDFFFFLAESLKKDDLIKPGIVIINNCHLLDSYTREFIQFFIEGMSEKGLTVIVFTSKDLFSFSDKHYLSKLNQTNLELVLRDLFPKIKKTDYSNQAELLYALSKGDIFLVEYILNDIKKKKKGFDLTAYLDSKLNNEDVYRIRVESLDKNQLYVLQLLFLTGFKFSLESLTNIVKEDQNSLNTKELPQILNQLESKSLVDNLGKIYTIKKWHYYLNIFLSLPAKDRFASYNRIISLINDKIFKDNYLLSSNVFESFFLITARKIDKEYGLPTIKTFRKAINYLIDLRDYNSLLTIYTLITPEHITSKSLISKIDQGIKSSSKKNLKLTASEKEQLHKVISYYSQLSIIYKRLNRYEDATNYNREALRIAARFNIPFDEILFELVDCLYKLNSLTFALEVIKKYSESITDIYYKCKINLMKADILIDLINDTDAKSTLDIVYEIYPNIEDENKRQLIFAETKKKMGKIYYYTNKWDKAETLYTEAGKIFSSLKRLEGEADIYNNIGVLMMYRGEWEKTEKLYLKSLDIEKQLFNLDGISVCYNNLGGLWADRGDYKKSLQYLYKALKIQKLVNDRYNICNIYNNIGVTYMDNTEFNHAEKSFIKTLELAKSFNLIKNMVAVLNNLGALYFKTGNWNKSIKCYEEAIDKSENNKFIEGLCKSYNNLGELYEKRGDYEFSYSLYFKASKIVSELNDEYQKAEIWGNLGNVLTHLHKFDKAYTYLIESIDFFKTLNAQDKIIEGCHKMAYYFIVNRNYDSASYYLDLALSKAEEIKSSYDIGKTLYLSGLLYRNDPQNARSKFEQATKIFGETKNYYELALANYEFADILHESGDWHQALEILENNKTILKDFGASVIIEKNEILHKKIKENYAKELKETKNEEYLLNKFYETTKNLKSISSFDTLLEYTLNSFVDLADANGGIMCLYKNYQDPDSWEYKLFNNITQDDKDYDIMIDIILNTFQEEKYQNFKQPSLSTQYNNIVSFPLTVHNQNLGVILLFTKYGNNHITDKVCNLLNALCNQAVVIIENFRDKILSHSHESIRAELNTPHYFTNIIGKSEKMQKIFRIIEKVKDTPTTILIEGKSGTGKELIARAIHYNSIRRNRKYIAQYCGSLPETLLESELFGHVKGSFTGAVYDKKGLFEITDGGTFFLDEIADISLSTQSKLLRFLQEGEVKRVGSTKTQKVDVRVICATNVPLKEKIEKGEFRLDLYYRLNVIKIEVPKLFERKSDIPLLAIHFLDKYNKKMGKKIKGMTSETMKCFENYSWPGNIRQLENEIERAVTLVEDDHYIKSSDLSEELTNYSPLSTLSNDYHLSNNGSLKDTLQEIESNIILESLKRNSWNQTQTAKELGLSRQGLIKKIKRYSLDKNLYSRETNSLEDPVNHDRE